MSAVDLAANRAKIVAGVATGDQALTREGVDAMSDDFRRSIRVPDPAARINPEAARAAAKHVAGVRSVVWLDQRNLFANVERNDQRSHATIDAICLELEPLGDMLAVNVNLQSGAAATGEELLTLTRNCQLPPGERALLDRKRDMDDIDPGIRAAHAANNGRAPAPAFD